MSEPTYPGDAPVRGDWSQVYTGLDWVAQWMSERGYSEAEVAYVLDRPVPVATPVVAVEPVAEAVEPEVDPEVAETEPEAESDVESDVTAEPVGADEDAEVGDNDAPTWTVSLTVA